MKVACPTLDNRGLESRVYGHFGSATNFVITVSVAPCLALARYSFCGLPMNSSKSDMTELVILSERKSRPVIRC